MNDIKISELEETDYLQGGCCFPLVQENETKKVSFETLKNELPQTEVMVGTTTTGEPGTDASVFNSGTPTAPILNFTIPKGDPGEQGKQGIQGPRGFKGDTAHDIYVGDKSAAPSEAKLIIEPVKGTATGTDIQVTDSVNDRVSKLALDGRSTQATSTDPASPSPDYPSEIENVKGENSFKPALATTVLNGITCTANRDGTYTLNGTATADATFTIGADRNLTVGKTYKFVGCPNGGSNTTYRIGWNFHGYEYGNGLISKKTTEARNVQITIFKGIKASNLIFRPMFTENTLSTYNDYVPYGNIQIVETGENLWKPFVNETRSGITITQNADGSVLLNGTATDNVFFKIALNKSFNEIMTLGYNYKNGSISNTNIFVRTRNANNKLVHDMSLSSSSKKGIVASTMNAEISYQEITVQKGATLSNVLLEIMLLKGTYNETNLPNYEPYKEEVVNIDLKGNELCSLPNGTKDELIVKDGRAKIVKRIGKVVLDGSENWGQNVNLTKDNTSYYYTYALDNLVKGTDQLGTLISNYFINQNTYDTDNEGISLSTIIPFLRLRINTSTAPTLAEFKAWLQANPVTLQYVSETPEEIDIEVTGNLQTCEGTSNITNSEDTNMSVEYVTNKTNLYYKNNGNIIKMNN